MKSLSFFLILLSTSFYAPKTSSHGKYQFIHIPYGKYLITVTRRIDQPDYQNLNPFIHHVNQYTYREGNPYLEPQFVNSVELS